MNPFFQLQQNLASLIAAHTYFKDAEKTPVLTEKLADLDSQVEQKILGATGFGVVITTARGQRAGGADETQDLPLVTIEELLVTIISAPLLDPAHNALDAVAAVIEAVNNQPALHDDMPWRVLSHDFVPNDRDGIITHQIRVSARCIF